MTNRHERTLWIAPARRITMAFGLAALVLVCLACTGTPGAAPPSAESVATFNGGEVTLDEVEARLSATATSACLPVRRARGSATLDALVPCYRDIARAIALEKLVAAETDDEDQALLELGDAYQALRNQAYLAPYRSALRKSIDVTDDEIAEYFQEHREEYRRPGQVTLWNLFRRHEDPNHPEATLAYLAGLKQEYEGGRPFDHLAREHSQSETRLRGGLVGAVAEGELPQRLEKVAFSLDDGEVSDPIPVRDGAVLLLVRNLVPGGEANFEAVQKRVRRDLVSERMERRIDQRLAERTTEGDLVLEADALFALLDATLDAGDPERVVLASGDETLSAADLRLSAALDADQRVTELDEPRRQHVLSIYQQQHRTFALVADLVAEADEATHRKARETIRSAALPLLVDKVLRAEMEAAVDADPESLRQYFEDNRAHYQSALRFDLQIWDLPFGEDPPAQLERMEALQRSLVAEEFELPHAAGSLGGEIRDLGWLTYDELSSELPNKAREYLLADSASFTVPYQHEDALHLIHVKARREPGPVEFEDVATQVRDDYVERFEQRLFDETAQRRLDEAAFAFHEGHLLDLLAAVAP